MLLAKPKVSTVALTAGFSALICGITTRGQANDHREVLGTKREAMNSQVIKKPASKDETALRGGKNLSLGDLQGEWTGGEGRDESKAHL